MKIRTKIALLFTILVASLLVLFSFSIFWFATYHRTEEFKIRLTNKGKSTANVLLNFKIIDGNSLNLIKKSSFNILQDENIIIFDNTGKKIYSYRNLFPPGPEKLKSLINQDESYFTFNDVEYVANRYTASSGEYSIITCAYDEFGHKRISRLKFILIIGVLISTLIISIIGWIFARNSLRPISTIIQEVQEISGKNLSDRLSTGHHSDELAKLSETFNQMLDRIQRTLQVQKTFLANASHELRTPLSIIRARIEIALTSPSTSTNYVETLEELYQEIKDLIELSNGLLEITQLDGGLKKEMRTPIRMDEILFSAVGECKRKYYPQKIELLVLSNDEKEMSILGYEALLFRCFVNLIDNACKYSSGNPVTVTIKTTDHQLVISITDEGIGIPAEQLEKIKKPFYRANNTKNFPGHGIGLSLVYKILEEHEASISIESTLNKGSHFQVFFPNSKASS